MIVIFFYLVGAAAMTLLLNSAISLHEKRHPLFKDLEQPSQAQLEEWKVIKWPLILMWPLTFGLMIYFLVTGTYKK